MLNGVDKSLIAFKNFSAGSADFLSVTQKPAKSIIPFT